MFDTDNNGTIDSSELSSVLQYMKEETPSFVIHTLGPKLIWRVMAASITTSFWN